MPINLEKKSYRLRLEQDPDGVYRLELCHPQKGRFFSFPVGVLFSFSGKTEACTFPELSYVGAERLEFCKTYADGDLSALTLTFTLGDDEIVAAFSAHLRCSAAIEAVELFRSGRKGLYMVDCIRYFAPAPRNYFGINRAFNRNFCDCSSDGYFSPPPLNFSVGNQYGWVSFGLLDLPNSTLYKLTPDLGILVEQPEGQIVVEAGAAYEAPRLLLTFPEDEWQGEALFRQKLLEKGVFSETQKESFPDWWQRPTVVTYGDQIMELQYNWYTDVDWGAPGFTQQWLMSWLDNAEKTLDRKDFTIIVDAFWQHRWSAEAKPDINRFPNLRGFIDECHHRGHKVLLWTAPLVDSVVNGFETLSQRMGVLSEDPVRGLEDECRYIDITSDRIRPYFAELSRMFFSSDPDALNCDGLKMDFLTRLQPPAGGCFQHPENGIGVRGLYRFYRIFNEEAKKVKADVLLNGSVCDPRFESILHMNRLHDIQNVFEERELRARASVLAAPNILVDSDGAIMLSDWVEETYLNAVVYSTPSLYYIRKFHDGRSLSAEKMKSLGRLLALSGRKPWGTVEFQSPGNWRLSCGGRIAAATFDGHTLLLQDKNGRQLHLFSWRSGVQSLPLFGMHPETLPAGFITENDTLTANLCAGEVYTLPLIQK